MTGTGSHFNRSPSVVVDMDGVDVARQGWSAVARAIADAVKAAAQDGGRARLVVVDCHTGVFEDEIGDCEELRHALALSGGREAVPVFRTRDALRSAEAIDALVAPDLTPDPGDDPVFGRLTDLELEDFFEPDRLAALRTAIHRAMRCEPDAPGAEGSESRPRAVLLLGVGAAFVAGSAGALSSAVRSSHAPSAHDLAGDRCVTIYADMPRWEHQLRFRRNEIANLGSEDRAAPAAAQYKRAFFVDWRACDCHKQTFLPTCDFVLDTTRPGEPRLVTGDAYRAALSQVVKQPFSVVPFFDPGPWGGQWMRRVCGLDDHRPADARPPNYAWCFNCVPEENSLLLQFGDVTLETPAINLVLLEPEALIGRDVYERFGEFPIRFDLLDTMGGGNLSLQVHPTAEYAREHFGLTYTQDESYYFLDAEPGAEMVLGLRNGADPALLERDLRAAHEPGKEGTDGTEFEAERHVCVWPVRKHDHVSIPAGTIHCQGRNSMVLEISATPYIFTFKLWDWGRVGLDGRPRPIHLERGLANLRWEHNRDWAAREALDRVEVLPDSPGVREERTGLHESQFIETRRHWFTRAVEHDTGGSVDVLAVVEGGPVVVESPSGAFEPFRAGYAEVFVVPAAVGPYIVRPASALAPDEVSATIKAAVR